MYTFFANPQINTILFQKDRTQNEMRQPAVHKRSMLPVVMQAVRKADLQEIFVDMGLIDAFSVNSLRQRLKE